MLQVEMLMYYKFLPVNVFTPMNKLGHYRCHVRTTIDGSGSFETAHSQTP